MVCADRLRAGEGGEDHGLGECEQVAVLDRGAGVRGRGLPGTDGAERFGEPGAGAQRTDPILHEGLQVCAGERGR